QELGTIFLVIAIPLMAYTLFMLFKVLYGLFTPRSNPVLRELLIHGNPREIADDIERDLQDAKPLPVGRILVTSRWIIHQPSFELNKAMHWLLTFDMRPCNFWAFPLDKLVWLYCPGVDSWWVEFITRDQRLYRMTGRFKQVRQVL